VQFERGLVELERAAPSVNPHHVIMASSRLRPRAGCVVTRSTGPRPTIRSQAQIDCTGVTVRGPAS
jgi:hypothetical protein